MFPFLIRVKRIGKRHLIIFHIMGNLIILVKDISNIMEKMKKAAMIMIFI
jgi:hypothetical protein